MYNEHIRPKAGHGSPGVGTSSPMLKIECKYVGKTDDRNGYK